MPKAVVLRTTWDELKVGMRISLQQRKKNRKVGSEFCGFVMEKLDDKMRVLFDHRSQSVWVQGAREYVEKGWIRFDPRRL